MKDKTQLRKEAYQYILQTLSRIPASGEIYDTRQIVPLEELRLIKDGVADPSPVLVALLKEWLAGTISEREIDSYLVKPFEK